MEVIPPVAPYAYAGTISHPSAMQDGGTGRLDMPHGPDVNAAIVPRNSSTPNGSKRRRLDHASALSFEDDHSGLSRGIAVAGPNDFIRQAHQWSGAKAVPTRAADSSLYDSADASSYNMGMSVASVEASAYPDLGGYQQPYFHHHNGDAATFDGTHPVSTAASSWAPASNNNATYAVADASDAMPYFPASNGVVGATSDNGVAAGASTFQYPDIDATVSAPQYAYAPVAAAQPQSRPSFGKSSAFYLDDASMHLKIQSLPILDNLTTQLIHTLAKSSFAQIQDLMKGADTEDSQAYKTLKNLFDQTRKVYSRETAFIDAIAIQMFQPQQQEIIRKANIATFISSILGAHDVSFFHLNEFFMETFVPLGHRLLKWQGAIYLDLKTQTYISALINSDGSPEEMLDELFPPDLDAQILTRHPDAPSLSPSEQDFIDRSRARKSYLLAGQSSDDTLKELPKTYKWSDFEREFASCISKNVEGIINVPARSQGAANGLSGKGAVQQDSSTALMLGAGRANGSNAALVAVQTALQGSKGAGSNGTTNGGGSDSRKASVSAVQRQPWTKPEEDALLAGLDRVNGPHWSQILALYGRGGSVSEVLKDRNQVQLKDKARNLKLWYLKTGKEVPLSLRGVTGELRKRGGARARAAMGITDDDDGAVGGRTAGAANGEDADAEENGDAVDPKLDGNGGGRAPPRKKSRKK